MFPAVIFLIEKFLRLRNVSIPSVIREARILPSEVIHLVVEKPPHFHHKPGKKIKYMINKLIKYIYFF